MKQRRLFDDAFDAVDNYVKGQGKLSPDKAAESVEPRGRRIQRWVQGEEGCGKGVCATVVIRWLKYKLIGSDQFWSVLDKGGVRWRPEKWRKVRSRHRYYAREAKGTKVDPAVHYGGQWAVGRLTGGDLKDDLEYTKAQKMRVKFKGLEFQHTKRIPIGDTLEIFGTVTEFSDCASYVSLGARYMKSLFSHAIGIFCTGNREVCFFDPNMGEVLFPDRFTFEQWWKNDYRTAWADDDHYRSFNTCRITRMHGLAELDQVRQQAEWLKKEMSPHPDAWLETLNSSMDAFGLADSQNDPFALTSGGNEEEDLDAELQAELMFQKEKMDPWLVDEDFN